MINEIKTIVHNYLNNTKLCQLMVGIVAIDGIKVSEKLIIPNELIIGNIKKNLTVGQRVRLLQNHGGQQFYILEVISE